MNKRKRNHWVPQAYLRQFAADISTRRKIWRLGKNSGEPELKPIEKVAVSFYLYTPFDKHGQRDYSFEAKLAELESSLGEPFWHQLCTEMVPLDDIWSRRIIALIAAVMYVRHPKQLEITKTIHNLLSQQISNWSNLPETIEYRYGSMKMDVDKWEAYFNLNDEDLKRLWLRRIGSIRWLAEQFVDMRWSVVFSNEPVFITSDNPIVVTHPSFSFKGFANKETQVVFPLSPTRILVMDHHMQEPDGLYYEVTDPGAWNHTIWNNDVNYIFSDSNPETRVAEILNFLDRIIE